MLPRAVLCLLVLVAAFATAAPASAQSPLIPPPGSVGTGGNAQNGVLKWNDGTAQQPTTFACIPSGHVETLGGAWVSWYGAPGTSPVTNQIFYVRISWAVTGFPVRDRIGVRRAGAAAAGQRRVRDLERPPGALLGQVHPGLPGVRAFRMPADLGLRPARRPVVQPDRRHGRLADGERGLLRDLGAGEGDRADRRERRRQRLPELPVGRRKVDRRVGQPVHGLAGLRLHRRGRGHRQRPAGDLISGTQHAQAERLHGRHRASPPPGRAA